MKKILPIVTLIIISTFFTSDVCAQSGDAASKWRLGLGLEALFPTNDNYSGTNGGFAVTPQLQYDMTEHLGLTLTTGYYGFARGHYTGGNSPHKFKGVIPVKAGVKAFVAPKFYFGAEAGAAFELDTYGRTKLALAPAMGYGSKKWDISGRYELFLDKKTDTYGFIGIRAAYNIGL